MKNQNFTLTEEEKKQLLNISRQTLQEYIIKTQTPKIDKKDLSKNLLTHAGAFVTLNKQKDLRGCIGRFTANEPLYKIVQQMTKASATEDSRFSTVTKEELQNIRIEISVLTPLLKIAHIDEIKIGKHGIYIKKGYSSGTLLPQVAVNNKWSVEEFLGYCSQYKAGFGWEGWKDAEIFTYEAIVFQEK